MKFAKIVKNEMRIICTDPYGSHVLETILHIFMDVISSKDEKLEKDYVEFCHAWICSVCQFAFNNVEDFICDIYASHILRTSLQCVSGVDVGVLTMKSNRSRKHLDGKEEVKVTRDLKSLDPKHSAAFLTILKDFADRFVGWPQLTDLVHSDDSSAVIQTVLLSLHTTLPEMSQKLLNVILNDIFSDFNEAVFDNSATVHLLEVGLCISDEKTFHDIYEKYFKSRTKTLAQSNNTKFAVIKLLENVKDKEVMTDIFEDLSAAMEDLFATGCGAVVLALGNACRRLSTLQGRFVQHLMETFHCYDPEPRQLKIVSLVSRLVTYDVAYSEDNNEAEKETYNVLYTGSQLVQTLLHFNKPIKIVQSLLEMDNSELRDLLCDSCGSRVMDAFVAAEFVGEKSREKLIQKLQGHYHTLACSKSGSRALDALWQSCDIKWRMTIGEELLTKEGALLSNNFGRILSSNYALPLLKSQKADWKSKQEHDSKKRKLFAGIVEPLGDAAANGDEPVKKKKRRNNNKLKE